MRKIIFGLLLFLAIATVSFAQSIPGGGSRIGDVTDVLGTANEVIVTNSAGPQPTAGLAPRQKHTLSAGAPAAGICGDSGEVIVDSTGEIPYYCSDGPGGNARNFASLGDAYNTVCDNDGNCVSASGSEQLDLLGKNNIKSTRTPGSPDKIELELNLPSQAQGDILYFNGTSWVRLAPGTSGQFLKTQGAGANPVWADLPP